MRPSRVGWVYVLTNPAMPGLVKIGCTSRLPADRARELSDKTGVPARFVVAWASPVSDWKAVEALAHSRLDHLRPNGNREFFRCSVRQARRAVQNAASAYLRPAWLRLFIGPRSVAASGPASRYPRRGDPLPVIGLLACLALVGLVAEFKPPVPSWLAPSAARTLLLIEGQGLRR